MRTLVLPYLVAGRDLADEMVDRLGDTKGSVVLVDARNLSSGSRSFASQLVRRLIVDGDAEQLLLVGAPDPFAGYVTSAASTMGAAGSLELSARPPADLPA